MARSGDAAGARREVDAIKVLRGALQKSDQSYWADRADEQMLSISAWIALAERKRGQAQALRRYNAGVGTPG